MDTMTLIQLVSVLVSDLVCPVLIAASLCVGVYFQVRKYYEDKASAKEFEAMWDTHDQCDVMKEIDDALPPRKSSRKRK